jgi:multiple sugar transport system substrate-binding protein
LGVGTKSTEVLFLNKTVFDRFVTETGAKYQDLQTFEGIAKTAALYYEWTDAQTPDRPRDGKAFYHADSLFNFTLIGCKQLGMDLIIDNKLDYSSDTFKRVWNGFYEPAVKGHFAIYDGYASDLIKTGEIICSTGSTAGVLFYDPFVTYPDNTIKPMELLILPYPTFEGGKKIAIQRGSGMVVTKSTKGKEYAAGLFLKWFTSPENNLRFIFSTGYLPVTQEAFGEVMSKEIEEITDKNIKTLLHTAIEMQSNYDFYIPPLFDGIDALQKDYEEKVKQTASQSREYYQSLLASKDKETAFEETKKGIFEQFSK